MKHRIISSSEIGKCRFGILSPRHWIPEHKTEECTLEKAEEVAKEEARIKYKFDRIRERLKEQEKTNKEKARTKIRRS